jgi:hypothetical protein
MAPKACSAHKRNSATLSEKFACHQRPPHPLMSCCHVAPLNTTRSRLRHNVKFEGSFNSTADEDSNTEMQNFGAPNLSHQVVSQLFTLTATLDPHTFNDRDGLFANRELISPSGETFSLFIIFLSYLLQCMSVRQAANSTRCRT